MDVSKRRVAILRFVAGYSSDHGYSPSFREIADGIGISNVSEVHRYMRCMRDEGLVNYVDHIPRTVTLTDLGREAADGPDV